MKGLATGTSVTVSAKPVTETAYWARNPCAPRPIVQVFKTRAVWQTDAQLEACVVGY